MNLHDVMRNDLNAVFLNLNEFASIHEINGVKLPCVVDDLDASLETRPEDGFSNVSGIGILRGERTVYCSADNLGQKLLPGQKITMDGNYWLVDDNLSETEGMLIIHLQRAY